MHFELIIITIIVAHFVAGSIWYQQDRTAQSAVADAHRINWLAKWLAVAFLVSTWPYWVYKYISLARHYMKTMEIVTRSRR
jgi:hypothetical protein